MNLILASASEGRKNLLSLFHVPFAIIHTGLDEDKILGKTPWDSISLRAKLKGEEVVKRIMNDEEGIKNYQYHAQTNLQFETHNPSPTTSLIISADTDVIIGEIVKELVGKAKDRKDAVRILKTLSHNTHEVVTGLYIILLERKDSGEWQKKKVWQEVDRSKVTFRQLTNDDIDIYLKLTPYTKYAGCYALFASPQDFIIKTEGSLSNIIGLPLEKIVPILTEVGLLGKKVRNNYTVGLG